MYAVRGLLRNLSKQSVKNVGLLHGVYFFFLHLLGRKLENRFVSIRISYLSIHVLGLDEEII